MPTRLMTRADDEAILEILDMHDGDGLYPSEIAKRLNTTRNSIIGKMHRITTAIAPCQCARPENKDGGMGRGWWRPDDTSRGAKHA